MHIAFYGSSLLSAYWNGAATYYRGLLGALAQLGRQVTFYEPDAFERQQHKDIEPPDWARVVVWPNTDTGLAGALAEAGAADVVVKASGVGVYDDELLRGCLDGARPDALRLFMDVDAPATLASMRAAADHPMHAALRDLDAVLTYGGGPPVVEAYQGFGAKHCVPIYNALDPAAHHPVPSDPRFRAELSFLANRLPDRERRVEAFFLDAAARSGGKQFLLGGNGWQDKPMPSNVRAIGHVGTADHNAFNCSALAVLNVARDSMAEVGFSPATRVFEAAGAGACLITDFWEGIDLFLQPGTEVLVARDGQDVADHLHGLTEESARAPSAWQARRGYWPSTPTRCGRSCWTGCYGNGWQRSGEVKRPLPPPSRGRAGERVPARSGGLPLLPLKGDGSPNYPCAVSVHARSGCAPGSQNSGVPIRGAQVGRQSHLRPHRAEQRAVGHHQHRGLALQRPGQRRPRAGAQVGEALGALGGRLPLDPVVEPVQHRLLFPHAERDLAQAVVQLHRQPQHVRHRLRRVPGAGQRRGDDGSDAAVAQAFGGVLRLGLPRRVQGDIDRPLRQVSARSNPSGRGRRYQNARAGMRPNLGRQAFGLDHALHRRAGQHALQMGGAIRRQIPSSTLPSPILHVEQRGIGIGIGTGHPVLALKRLVHQTEALHGKLLAARLHHIVIGLVGREVAGAEHAAEALHVNGRDAIVRRLRRARSLLSPSLGSRPAPGLVSAR